MRGGGQRKPPADTQEFYDLLGVEKSATASEIKKAFRKKAMKHHPDRGGDEELFKKIQEAHEVLSDDDKRKLYDEGGKEAVEQGGSGGGGGGADIFDLFGGGGRRRGQAGPRKGETTMHKLQVDLKDMYNGRVRKLAINRSRQANPGAKPKMCDDCDGRGVVLKVRQLGPGMLQQVQMACDTPGCDDGYLVKMKKERKVLEVAIEKGMKNGQKIKFAEEGDQKPGGLPGDVVFVLECKKHPVFTRKGPHLFMGKKISLKEALTGIAFTVEHLDGRILHVTTEPGAVIADGSAKMVEHEGMPMHGNPFVKGNLVIQFEIDYPERLDPETAKQLESLLPGGKEAAEETEDMEPCILRPFDAAAAQAEYEQNKSAYDSDDEDEGAGGGRRVQCAQG